MNDKLRAVVVCMFAIFVGTWGCEINIENRVQEPEGDTVDDRPDGVAPDAADGGGEDTVAEDTYAPDTETPDDADAMADGDAGGDGPNDQYPCKDNPQIPKERCQGGEAWDEYEDQELIERGKYVANHVAICTDCHTPVDTSGEVDCPDWYGARNCKKEYGGWNLPWYEFAPQQDNLGGVGIPNITPHPDGIGEWSPEELRKAFTEGIRPEDQGDYRIIFPVMPYYQFHYMKEKDQDAVIAYLHSLDPVASGDPPKGPYDRQPQPDDSPYSVLDKLEPMDWDDDGDKEGIKPASEEFMPPVTLEESDENYEEAKRGKYLARMACTQCHTPSSAPDPNWSQEETLKKYMFFERGKKGMIGATSGTGVFGAKWPEAPFFGDMYDGFILAQNITGDKEYGVGDWTLDQIIRSVNGIDKNNQPMCPPMPVNTWYSQMKEKDKRAIALYLKHSKGRAAGRKADPEDCQPPEQ